MGFIANTDFWNWTCTDSGGSSGTCTASKKIDAACGSANGQAFPTKPTTNLCSIGFASTVTGSGPWSWICEGTNGGANSNVCNATVGDNTSPTISNFRLAGGALYTNSATVTIAGTLSEAIQKYILSENNSQPASGDSRWIAGAALPGAYTLGSLTDGLHTIYSWAMDLAGNISTSAASDSITVDTTPPVINNTSISPTTTYATSRSVTATRNNTNETLSYYSTTGTTCNTNLSDSLFTDYINPPTFNSAGDNGKRVCFLLRDVAGNKTYSLSDPISNIVNCSSGYNLDTTTGQCVYVPPSYTLGGTHPNGGKIFYCDDVNNCTSGLVAQQADAALSVTWDTANNTCSAAGWRLPTSSELDTMYSQKASISSLPQSSRYWGDQVDSLKANTKNFATGSSAQQYMSGAYNTRCIKSF